MRMNLKQTISRGCFLAIIGFVMSGCSSLVSYQPPPGQVQEGAPLKTVINDLLFFAGKENIKYWCNGLKDEVGCFQSCSECQVLVAGYQGGVVFLEGVGDSPTVRWIENFQPNKSEFIRQDVLITYDIARAIFDGKIVNGMTVQQVKASREMSRFEEQHWCGFSKVTSCDESCLNCSSILFEYDLQQGRDKTIYLNSHQKPIGAVDNQPRVYKLESFINQLAQPF